jgi:hypothetical protein
MMSFMSQICCYCFHSLPFGVASGPSAFRKVICQILAGLPGCASILDDIISFGVDVADHDANLRRVLAALAKANATVCVDKCVSGQPSFVSTANYYLKFVQRFADLCDPIRRLLKADTPWHWSDQHQ